VIGVKFILSLDAVTRVTRVNNGSYSSNRILLLRKLWLRNATHHEFKFLPKIADHRQWWEAQCVLPL